MLDFSAISEVLDIFDGVRNEIVGAVGESIFNQAAKKYLSDDYILINDIVLKSGNGTTQIDQVIVSKFGLFVIEIKNYKGWIWGNANSQYWIQTLSKGSKNKFQNPLRQNYKHIKALEYLLKCQPNYLKSLVVFSSFCQFKTSLPSNVVQGEAAYINYIKEHKESLISDDEVKEVTQKVLGARLDASEYRKHIQKVKNQYQNADENTSPECPKCGKNMVLRKSKSGPNLGRSFWGCSSYPQCRGIVNIKTAEEKVAEDIKKIHKLFKRIL